MYCSCSMSSAVTKSLSPKTSEISSWTLHPMYTYTHMHQQSQSAYVIYVCDVWPLFDLWMLTELNQCKGQHHGSSLLSWKQYHDGIYSARRYRNMYLRSCLVPRLLSCYIVARKKWRRSWEAWGRGYSRSIHVHVPTMYKPPGLSYTLKNLHLHTNKGQYHLYTRNIPSDTNVYMYHYKLWSNQVITSSNRVQSSTHLLYRK